MFSVAFSNRIERLYQELKNSLYTETSPFAQRLIVVPSPLMKSWLVWQMANDPDLGVATGFQVCYLDEAMKKLLISSRLHCSERRIPSVLEVALLLENEMRQVLSLQHGEVWDSLRQYVGNLESMKGEKRLVNLSHHLARLFEKYAIYGGEVINLWTQERHRGWQQELWRRLFDKEGIWECQADQFHPKVIGKVNHPLCLSIFALSNLPPLYFRFLNEISKQIPISYFLLSPCREFWSDICSDHEIRTIQKNWEKSGIALSRQIEGEEYLINRNRILGNCGALGRGMARMVEESSAQIVPFYQLNRDIESYSQYQDLIDETLLSDEEENELTLLTALQADFVLMRNPDDSDPLDLKDDDRSFSLHVASSRYREVEILYDNLLGAIQAAKENGETIYPSEIIVMAPDITKYEPFIKAIFGSNESRLDFQVFDSKMQSEDHSIQALTALLSLGDSRWMVSHVFQLFEKEPFQRRFRIPTHEVELLKKWAIEAHIHWGRDVQHREEIHQREGCSESVEDSQGVGTWHFGLDRLLISFLQKWDQESSLDSPYAIPLEGVELSKAPLAGKFISILRSIQEDLSLLYDGTRMTVLEWTHYLEKLIEAYLQPEEDAALRKVITSLEKIGKSVRGVQYQWRSIHEVLNQFLDKETVTYQENHAQAVRFCSMLPMRAIPAKIVALMGLDEESYPKKPVKDGLNLLDVAYQGIGDWCPTPSDYDRYLFLEAILSARKTLFVSYSEENDETGDACLPSLIVKELLEYLDSAFRLGDRKVSEVCVIKHPFYAFDTLYFEGKDLKSYSRYNFELAESLHKSSHTPSTRSFPELYNFVTPQGLDTPSQTVQIRHLMQFCRNPIKAYMNRTLGIYFEEQKQIEDEDLFQVSHLDRYIYIKNSLKQPSQSVMDIWSRRGDLPTGCFQALAKENLQRDVDEIEESLRALGTSRKELSTIVFDAYCDQWQQQDDHIYIAPAPIIQLENGSEIVLEGILEQVSPLGLCRHAKYETSFFYKSWIEILLLNLLPDRFERRILLTKSGHAVDVGLSHVEKWLQRYIENYFIGLHVLSPLVPDWIEDLQNLSISEFKVSINNKLKKSWGGFSDPYLDRLLLSDKLDEMDDTYWEFWKNNAEEMFENRVLDWSGVGYAEKI